jgi:hypothetical protein
LQVKEVVKYINKCTRLLENYKKTMGNHGGSHREIMGNSWGSYQEIMRIMALEQAVE